MTKVLVIAEHAGGGLHQRDTFAALQPVAGQFVGLRGRQPWRAVAGVGGGEPCGQVDDEVVIVDQQVEALRAYTLRQTYFISR